MENIKIIDSFIDDREFRNYVITFLESQGYTLKKIDDERVSDRVKNNDNDFLVFKSNKLSTVQTFLNKDITEKEINETIRDMKKENVDNAIIVTNKNVNKDTINKYKSENITIIDRKELINWYDFI